MSHTHCRRWQGFTIIDLALIFAILGIIAAAVIPRFMVYTIDSQTIETSGLAHTLAVAASQNYSLRSQKSTDGRAIKNCKDVALLLDGGLQPGYSIPSMEVPPGKTVNCTLTGPRSSTNTFDATGIE